MGPKCNPIYPYNRETEGTFDIHRREERLYDHRGEDGSNGTHEQLKEVRNSFSLSDSEASIVTDFWPPELREHTFLLF